ncbi:hypothetical protein GCM10023257_47750 [Streptomyces hyderabadensis]|uniref:DUF2335 domain-containing protein n=1 Tax=Streptomyces hyderabadensis TaxID=598549 RepID=A0ABP9II98_9ACTN
MSTPAPRPGRRLRGIPLFRRRPRGPEPEPEPNPRTPEGRDLIAFREYQSVRAHMQAQASQNLDSRLNLAKDSAVWNTATFGTLTLSSLTLAITLAVTGFTWWVLAPLAGAALFLWLLVVSVDNVRRGGDPRRR